jgi:ABC-2 type transport system permease protein
LLLPLPLPLPFYLSSPQETCFTRTTTHLKEPTMSTAALTLPAPRTNTLAQNLRIFLAEIRSSFTCALRTKAFSIASIGFPVMFYVLFGLIMNHGELSHGVSIAKYMLGGYAVFGMVGAALFGIGVGLATEINAGWLELKRASPMPPAAYLLAKCVTAMAFGVIIVSILCVLGIAFGHVTLTIPEYAKMIALTLVGAIPFTAIGLVLALLVPANAVPGVVNMIYLPMSFLSGLWIPIFLLPHWLRSIAPFMPTYHLSQLMLSVFGYQTHDANALYHWLYLLGFSLIAFGIAIIAFRRREQNS